MAVAFRGGGSPFRLFPQIVSLSELQPKAFPSAQSCLLQPHILSVLA